MGFEPKNVRAVGIIPARFSSTRLPGKPLSLIGGKPMIEWVYRRAERALGMAVVATDDERIQRAVEAFGGLALMTSDEHQSGTDRVAESLMRLRAEGIQAEVVVNVQGDEPFVDEGNLRRLVGEFSDETVQIATLTRRFAPEEDAANPSWPKVVTDDEGNALLFSRSLIPFARNAEVMAECPRLKHIGVYAFRPNALLEVSRLPQCALERLEGLEQLRWLHAGYRIRTVEVSDDGLSVDTPEDLAHANQIAEGMEC